MTVIYLAAATCTVFVAVLALVYSLARAAARSDQLTERIAEEAANAAAQRRATEAMSRRPDPDELDRRLRDRTF